MMSMSCERIAPTNMPAVMCLNSEGAPLFATAEARKLCALWNQGLKDGGQRSARHEFRLPLGINSLLRAAFNRGWDVHTSGIRVRHPSVPELAVTIHTGESMPELQPRPHCLLTFIVDSSVTTTAPSGAELTLDKLTPSERRVALLVAEGLRNEEIAQRLQRSRRTIEYQLNAIFRKLDMTSRTQLVRVLV